MQLASRMANKDADILVLGGGCAGLSLAARLADRTGPRPRVIVLEQRPAYSDDRTFSFWRGHSHPFEKCVRSRWSKWRVGYGNRVIDREHALFRYETIAGADFYAAAQDMIAAAPWVDLRLGVRTTRTGTDEAGVWAETDQGLLRAELLIDTRPLAPRAAGGLLQVFSGCEVQTDGNAFDAGTAELMMFDPPHEAHVGFCYALPFARDRALLEYTRFAVDDVAPPDMNWVIDRIAARLHCGFTICRTESGALPMHVLPAPPRGPRRVLRLGTLAGAARASTGYAFTSIQTQASCLAERLRLGWPAALGWQAPVAPRWMREMDRAFLRVLRADPRQGPGIFLDLFEHCPPESLVRFLSGTGGLCDAMQVARALPVAPFARGMFRGGRA